MSIPPNIIPPPVGGYIASGAQWMPASSTGVAVTAVTFIPPPVGVYLSPTGNPNGAWTPATSS